MDAKALKVAPDGIVDKLAWILIVDRKVLFARSKSQAVLCYTVGGKRERGETDQQALRREAEEEASVMLLPETIRHLHTFVGACHGYVEGTKLHMTCYTAEYNGMLAPQNEIAELVWLGSRDTHRTTQMGVDILQWLKAQDLID